MEIAKFPATLWKLNQCIRRNFWWNCGIWMEFIFTRDTKISTDTFNRNTTASRIGMLWKYSWCKFDLNAFFININKIYFHRLLKVHSHPLWWFASLWIGFMRAQKPTPFVEYRNRCVYYITSWHMYAYKTSLYASFFFFQVLWSSLFNSTRDKKFKNNFIQYFRFMHFNIFF